MRFLEFLEKDEEISDINRLLDSIPRSHAALVRGYAWKFQPGNTLDGDDEHVGYIDHGKKEIAVAAPWRYPREFTILHEIAHQVWNHLTPDVREEWHQMVKKNPHRQKQNDQELFCMAYAATYSTHPPITHYHPAWEKFIKERVPK